MQKGIAQVYLLIILLIAGGLTEAYFLGKSSNKSVISHPIPSITQQPTKSADETANWKTYSFESFKLSFKYPADWFVSSSGSAQFPTIRVQNYDPNIAPARGYDSSQDKGKYLIEITRLPWGNSGIFNLVDLKNKIPKNGDDAYYIGDPAGKIIIKTERQFEINSFPALYRETAYTNKPELTDKATYLLDKSGYAIEVRFGLDESGGKGIMNQILSTFKFTN